MDSQISILEILWDSGPVVKLVLLLLLAASVYSWAIIFKKKKTFKIITKSNISFKEHLEKVENIEDIYMLAKDNPTSSFSTIFFKANAELLKLQKTFGAALPQHFKSRGHGSIERALKSGVNDVNLELDSMLSHLASIGSVSPFVGLLGTVWGIINSFSGLSSGGSSIESVAPGIAEALVATAVGLFAAIPAVWAFNNYTNKISQINTDMESFGQDLINNIERTI